MDPVALQWLDNFLLDNNVGQALFVLFLPIAAMAFLTRSRQVFSLILGLFGVVFALTPIQAAPIHWRFLGFALIVVAPLIYLTSSE